MLVDADRQNMSGTLTFVRRRKILHPIRCRSKRDVTAIAKGASAIKLVVAASVQHQSEFDSSNDTGVSCRMVWRLRHNRQELERLSGRISAILLTTELRSGAI
jgi:hypothetical protein